MATVQQEILRQPIKESVGMSISEAAVVAGVSESTLYSLAAQGRLPGARRVGKRIIIHRETFNQWLSEGMGD